VQELRVIRENELWECHFGPYTGLVIHLAGPRRFRPLISRCRPARPPKVRRAGRLQTPVETKLRQRLTRALAVVDEHGTRGARLMDDADRLWRRCVALLDLKLVEGEADRDALELACYAMQLPMRSSQNLPSGKLGRTNLRDRTEQAAELLVGAVGQDVPEELVDRVTNILLAMPHRKPASEEAKLLADAVNLDDFGLIGVITRAIQLGRQGDGVNQVHEGNEKREQYGYWEARLKDGFHFDPVRKLARERLASARQVAKLLADELGGAVP
jgi:hypothetical protein